MKRVSSAILREIAQLIAPQERVITSFLLLRPRGDGAGGSCLFCVVYALEYNFKIPVDSFENGGSRFLKHWITILGMMETI